MAELPRSGSAYRAVYVFFVGTLFVGVSSLLIAYNKFLMQESRFPFPLCLVLIHVTFSGCCSAVLFAISPSLFPALNDPEKRVEVNRDLYRTLMPIAALFTCSLVLSNSAYRLCSVAFLQMVKEMNVVIAYWMSCVASLECFSWVRLRIVVACLLAFTMTVRGEIMFSMVGFLTQLSCQFFECFKLVLQSLLLGKSGRTLDPMSYVLLVMPLCATLLGIAILCQFLIQGQAVPVAALTAMWPHLLANACVAFLLNVVAAAYIASASAMGLIFTGIIKDILIVLTGVGFLGERVSALQGAGFLIQTVCIFVWPMVKMFPAHFEHGVLEGLRLLAYECRHGAKERESTLARTYGVASPA